MITNGSLEQIREAICIGRTMIQTQIMMAANSRKLGHVKAEQAYFGEACNLNSRLISLEAQAKYLESIN